MVLKIRPVTDQDCEILWKWVNDPDVRTSAFQSDPISWEEHLQWFQKKKRDDSCQMFLVTDASDTPIGQVRFERKPDGTTLVDVSIAKEHRGKGYAGNALRLSCQRLFKETAIRQVEARIKARNFASLRSFKKAGFATVGNEKINGENVFRMRLMVNE